MENEKPIDLNKRLRLGKLGLVFLSFTPAGQQLLRQALGPQPVHAQEEIETDDQIRDEIILFAKENMSGAARFRVSNLYQGKGGLHYIAWQNLILQRVKKGEIQPWNTLDEMHDLGLDRRLDRGDFGVTVPPKKSFPNSPIADFNEEYEERVDTLRLPNWIVDYAKELKPSLDPGLPTSSIKNYGSYEVGRFQRMAFQRWTTGPEEGQINQVLIGDAAHIAGLVPKEAILGFAEEDPHIIPTPRCQAIGPSQVGVASYYTERGCLGCRADRRMANGERFDENALTLAYMRAPLNTWVEIVNRDNGKSVIARVTDRGGFEPYGRIADVSRAVADILELRTDQSSLVITPISCG